MKGQVGQGSKSCRNNTDCCCDKGVALAGRGGGGTPMDTRGQHALLELTTKARCGPLGVPRFLGGKGGCP